MSYVKAVLFDAYDGFADKRIKNLDKGVTFEVDDRDASVMGADRKPVSWFCQIHAYVVSEDEVRVRLLNAPLSGRIEKWAEKTGAKIRAGVQPILDATVNRGEQAALAELAAVMPAPRVAKSLEKLKSVLDEAWPPEQRSAESRPGSVV